MPREDARTKARRLLAEGRLIVRLVDEREIRAICRGDHGEIYSLGHDAGSWYCTCPAKTTCSHLYALMSVTVVSSGVVAAIGQLTKEGTR
jgi:uncharacterized Zn finger protein